eukprot:TRINITY_DN2608_c0_g1_i1.p1 TRINITY_DN2608_c0_g1~~TRINITY_DN2608_c0_g1_i1.p1  ORF type:complete len:597 (-),score=180.54 TRINITY_DN2608_c0_g1_i1:92-1882(-)
MLFDGQLNRQGFPGKIGQIFCQACHYESFLAAKDKSIKPTEFRLKHYAGDVTYETNGFLDKNKDTLFRDVLIVMSQSTDPLIAELFPPVNDSRKRPETSGSQFRTAMAALIDTLLKCQPHYVRCIKPNDLKKANNVDEQRTRHQIRYLGLVENVRVRRAGFANRQEYKRFLERYKMTTPSTWPRWKGDDRSGVVEIIKYHKIPQEEFRLGKTKVFIKNPQTLFSFEEKRSQILPKIITKIQALWRGYWQCQEYKKTRAAMNIQAAWRGYTQRAVYIKTMAAVLIQKHWRGHKHRKQWKIRKAAMKISLFYFRLMVRRYINHLGTTFGNVKADPFLGKKLLWPKVPSSLQSSESYLKTIFIYWRARRMVNSLNGDEKIAIKQKFVAYDIFHNNKYWNPRRKYEADYLDVEGNPHRAKFISVMQKIFLDGGDTQVLFGDLVTKINSKNKPQARALVITDSNIYKQDPKNYKMTKGGIPLSSIVSINLTKHKDTFCHIVSSPPHPDVLVDLTNPDLAEGPNQAEERLSEFVTVLVAQCKVVFGNDVGIHYGDSWTYNNSRSVKGGPGKELQLKFLRDPNIKFPVFKKGKNNLNFVYYVE